MKALLLAAAWTIACAAAAIVAFRLAPERRGARLMLVVFLASVPGFVVSVFATPPDLGILPAGLVESSTRLELVFGLWLYTAIFFGGVLQLYNIADRGFSLRILIDIVENGRGGASAADVRRGYGAGRGIEWMLDKRLQGMLENGFIVQQPDGRYLLTGRGQRTARTYRGLKTFLRLGQGG